jgi:hypothetical protein
MAREAAAARAYPKSGNGEALVAGRHVSWTLQESEIESCEHQDNSYIHRQPFPEMVSEEQEIHGNYNGYHQHDVKYASCLSSHFESPAQI